MPSLPNFWNDPVNLRRRLLSTSVDDWPLDQMMSSTGLNLWGVDQAGGREYTVVYSTEMGPLGGVPIQAPKPASFKPKPKPERRDKSPAPRRWIRLSEEEGDDVSDNGGMEVV